MNKYRSYQNTKMDGCLVNASDPPRQIFFAVCFNTRIGIVVMVDTSSSVDKRPIAGWIFKET